MSKSKIEYTYIEDCEHGGAFVKSQLPTTLLMKASYYVTGIGALLMTTQFGGIAGLITAIALGILILVAYNARTQNSVNELLAFYAYINKPIFVYNESADDDEVIERKHYHEILLRDSGNTHYQEGDITIVVILFRDPKTGIYTESWEQYIKRRDDYIISYLCNWAEMIEKVDRDYFIKHQLQQK